MKTAVYPGSFDPATYGHIDIIRRAAAIFDRLVISVMHNSAKSTLFSTGERVNILKEITKDMENVEVDTFSGLTIDYCREKDIHIIIRGLRAVTDFEYELQIAQTNKELSHNNVDTVFLTTNLRYSYLSSSVVREIAQYHGDVSECVPPFVQEMLYRRYGHM